MTEGRSDRIERWAGPTAGLVGGVVSMTGLALSDIGGLEGIDPYASAETVGQVFVENGDRFRLGTTVLMIGLFFMVWFLVHLQTRLNPDGPTRWVASVATVGGLIAITLMALVVAYARAGLQTTFTGTDAVIPKGIVVFHWDYWRTWAPFISAHMLASGIAILRASLLPRIIGWGAVMVAFAPLVAPPGLMTAVFMTWTVVFSTGLLIKTRKKTSSSA